MNSLWALTDLEQEALLLSLRVALCSIFFGLPFAIATAWLLARRNFAGKTLLDGLVHLPLVVPPVVVGYLLLLLFSRTGPLGAFLKETFNLSIAFTWEGAALASCVMAFPLMVRSIRLSLESVDRGIEDAARTLGAGKLNSFFTITLPLTAPGLLTATLLGFARSLGEFGATITFVSNIPGETRTLPLALYGFAQQPGGEFAALRLAILSVILALGALACSEIMARRIQARLEG